MSEALNGSPPASKEVKIARGVHRRLQAISGCLDDGPRAFGWFWGWQAICLVATWESALLVGW